MERKTNGNYRRQPVGVNDGYPGSLAAAGGGDSQSRAAAGRGDGSRQIPSGAGQNGSAGDGSYRRSASGAGRGGGSRYADKRRSAVSSSRRNPSTASGSRRRKKSRRNRNGLYVCLVIVLLLVSICAAGTILLYRHSQQSAAPEISVDLDSLDSPYAYLVDRASGTVIGSKRGTEVIYPASMTKILTVLTAIRHISNLDETITMSYDYYDELYAQDASRAGFEPGEEAVIRDLLYGALLPSGAECCMQLSIQAAGSEEAFVELMNQEVAKLGLTQTHFANSTGLHDEQQYTTCGEMAAILDAALKNDTFYQVFTTPYYTVGTTSVHPEGFTFWSTLFKNIESAAVTGGEIKGGKTGYTQEAGHCLASMAEIGGREYILVTAGWAENVSVNQYHINDAFRAYNLVGSEVNSGEAV